MIFLINFLHYKAQDRVKVCFKLGMQRDNEQAIFTKELL